MKNAGSKLKSQFVVLVGEFDDSPEAVTVAGIFPSLKAAQDFVKEEYAAASYMDAEEEEVLDLDFEDALDDGHSFWKIVKA